MKVAVIAFANLRVTPYLNIYLDILKEQKANVDIIFWDRHSVDEEVIGCRNYIYHRYLPDGTNKARKLAEMKMYTHYVKKILKCNKYDYVIVLTSLLGIMLRGYLIKHMRGRYIFDIRDHSYEHMSWYYGQMKKLMLNSSLNVVSSEGFNEFLPIKNSVLCHNCSFDSLSDYKLNIKKEGRIIIAFVGSVRYASAYKKFILKIKNNPKINFEFYGSGEDEDELNKYCVENDILNVVFHGAYSPKEKASIIEKVDVLFNVYGTDIHVKYALSNKYYEALYYKTPIIVNRGTAMDNCTGILSYKYDESFTAEDFIAWYENINCEEFNRVCDEKLQKILEDKNKFRIILKKALKE